MKHATLTFALLSLALSLFAQKTITLSKAPLQDKIKGGCAGQAIGVTYGRPTEFQYKGTMIQDYQTIICR